MDKWLRFAALLCISVVAVAAAFVPLDGVDHGLLFLALMAAFWASDARYWKHASIRDD